MDDVVDVHITRLDPLRRDFQRLELLLPDQEIELFFVSHQGGTTPTWHGTTSEQIDEALRLHVAEEKITATIRGEPLTKPLHIEKAIERLRERQRGMHRCMLIFGLPPCRIIYCDALCLRPVEGGHRDSGLSAHLCAARRLPTNQSSTGNIGIAE